MKALAMVCAGFMAAAVAAGCGGGAKEAAEPEPVSEPAPEPAPADEYMVPQEKLDIIEQFLARQRKFVARCWGKALEAKEVPVSDAGKISISFNITTSGSVSNARVTEASHDSKALADCVISKAERWKITTLEEPLDYSYTFGFQRL